MILAIGEVRPALLLCMGSGILRKANIFGDDFDNDLMGTVDPDVIYGGAGNDTLLSENDDLLLAASAMTV
ncbi:MAG: hypothetical protein H7317_16430 [Pseudorhodobacter sp.]|nr:hypothetical protein [Pseudorhodobacter sp.]